MKYFIYIILLIRSQIWIIDQRDNLKILKWDKDLLRTLGVNQILSDEKQIQSFRG